MTPSVLFKDKTYIKMEQQNKIDLILSFDVDRYLKWHSLFYIDLKDDIYNDWSDEDYRRFERQVMRAKELKWNYQHRECWIIPEYDFKKM